MDEMNELNTNELVIRKKKYAYIYLIIVLVLSVVFSDLYFTSLVEDVYAASGESISGDNVYADLESTKDNFIDNEYKNNDIFIPEDVTDEIINNDPVTQNSGDENILAEIENKNDNQILEENNINSEMQNYYSNNRKLDANKPMVALTFDDGPDPQRTIKMLDILKKYNAVATFFDIGNLMEKYPEVVKKEVKAGCDVGGHTYSHVNLNSLSQSEAKKEIQNVEKAYKEATGLELKYIRPTYGNANSEIRKVIDRPIINWSVDSLDWKHRDADKVIAEIRKTKNLDGKVILMHVIYDSTLEAMDKLIPELIKEGYQIVTISELAEYKGYNLEEGKIYNQFSGKN